MSIEMFAGIVTGMLFALLTLLLGRFVRQKRGRIEADERTRMVLGRASTVTLWVTGAILFVGWVAENLLAYQRGGTIRFLTPWSAMLFILLAVFAGAYAFVHQRYSADETDAHTIARKRQVAVINLLYSIFLVGMSSSPAVQGDSGLRYVLLVQACLLLIFSVWSLVRHPRRRHSAIQ